MRRLFARGLNRDDKAGQADDGPAVDGRWSSRRSARLMVDPNLVDFAEVFLESPDQVGIPKVSRALLKNDHGAIDGHCFSIGPVAGHCIKCITDGQDASIDGNVLARQFVWIAFSVPVFMMVEDSR